MQIKGNTFVITGAAEGIGFYISSSLASQGANIVMVDINESALNNANEIVSKNSANLKTVVADVTDENDVKKIFSIAIDEFGAVDGLINNAGIIRDALLVKATNNKIVGFMTLKQWQEVIDLNLTGVFLCGREVAKVMIENDNSGVIINISSVAQAGNIGQSNYSAAKAGVSTLGVTWAKELSRYNIRVATIAPGLFDTKLVKSMKKEAYDRLVSQIPLKRTGKLEEIANSVSFIINNDYFTGRTLELDGGWRL